MRPFLCTSTVSNLEQAGAYSGQHQHARDCRNPIRFMRALQFQENRGGNPDLVPLRGSFCFLLALHFPPRSPLPVLACTVRFALDSYMLHLAPHLGHNLSTLPVLDTDHHMQTHNASTSEDFGYRLKCRKAFSSSCFVRVPSLSVSNFRNMSRGYLIWSSIFSFSFSKS